MGKTPGSYMGLMLSAGLSVFLAGNERSFGKNGAFRYDAITEPIVGASFSVDVAALTAHRYVGASEVNFARLLDLESGLGSWICRMICLESRPGRRQQTWSRALSRQGG